MQSSWQNQPVLFLCLHGAQSLANALQKNFRCTEFKASARFVLAGAAPLKARPRYLKPHWRD